MNSALLLHIDSIQPGPDEPWIELRGWLAADVPVNRVAVPLSLCQDTDWEERPDVRKSLPGKPHVRGFSTRLKADTVDLRNLHLIVETMQGREDFRVDWAKSPISSSPPTSEKPSAPGNSLDAILTLPGTNSYLTAEQREHYWTGERFNFLTEAQSSELRVEAGDYVSAHGYPKELVELIEKNPDGLMLDCGAGLRKKTFPNVIHFEPVPYPSTHVQGIAEALPFSDNSFHAVFSLSVLEHVKDPYRAAREMIRVLKPGGFLHLEMPFLIQEHGFPHHYCNMTARGLANLVEDQCTVLDQRVPVYGHPIHALAPLLQTWCDHLGETEREQFKHLTVGELLQNYETFKDEAWITNLPPYVQKKIAAVTRLVAIKKNPL